MRKVKIELDIDTTIELYSLLTLLVSRCEDKESERSAQGSFMRSPLYLTHSQYKAMCNIITNIQHNV